MAGRPRTTSNDDILAGAARVLARLGPARLALADVGAEVGLAPATLVQRFGSKRGLLLALAEQAAGVARAEFAAARRSEGAPLETLVAVLCAMTRAVSTPEALANNLAFLQLDRDPAAGAAGCAGHEGDALFEVSCHTAVYKRAIGYVSSRT